MKSTKRCTHRTLTLGFCSRSKLTLMIRSKGTTRTRKHTAALFILFEREGLNHLEAPALAKVVEYGSRLAEDQTKLSTKFPEIADLVREANFYATQDGAKIVKDVHIKKALDEKVYGSNLLHEKIKEMIERGIILIETAGAQVGQET